jgi:hypothetical protein
MDNKALVYLELATDQIFYINGFKKETIEPYLNTENEPRGLYAMWQEFDLIFNKTTKIPKIEKFYYPIVFSRWEFNEIINEISIHPKIIKRIRSGQCKILILNPFEGWTWSQWDELASILQTKFNISADGIVFMSGNYYPNPKHKTITFNTWERQIYANYRACHNTKGSSHHSRTLSRVTDNRPHKFICLNRRPSIHRYAVVTELYDIKDKGILTCASNAGYGEWYRNWVEENFLHNYPELSDKYTTDIKPNLPLTFDDGLNPEIDNPAANETVAQSEKYYNSYLYVVTETFFEGMAQGENTLFLSEKIFKPIVFFQPFIVFGRPGTINLLHKLGYKTFGDYIDESYDSIENDKQRLLKAVESIKEFTSLPYGGLTKLMSEMLPIFKHNYEVLKQRHDVEIFKNLKADLYNCLHGEH